MAAKGLTRAIRVVMVLAACAGVEPRPASSQTQAEFFDDGTLQEVRLLVNSRDWATLRAKADENTFYPADMVWRGLTVRNVGIRSRGSGTRNGSKPGLKIDVNRYLSNQEFLGLKGFILDNVYDDPSLVRESVTMKLFARMGIAAPREAHARLYVNNEYAGVYVIVEPIDRTFVSRVFGAQEAGLETGGFLFEYRWQFLYHLSYLGPALEAYASLFKPQTRETASVASLYRPIEEMIREIADAPDGEFAERVGRFLDLPLFMKHLAVENFMADSDGIVGNWGLNNFYLYRFRQSDRSQFIPWDKDHAFESVTAPVMLRMDTTVLARRSMEVPALRRAYFDALEECARLATESSPGDSRGWLERTVARLLDAITPALLDDPVYPFTLEDFQNQSAILIDFSSRRAAFARCDAARAEEVAGVC